MATEVSTIETRLTADTAQHDKALAASEKKLDDFGKGASDAGIKSWGSKVSASIAQFGKQLEDAGKGLTVGLTLPLVALGKQIVDVGFSYEKAMNTFQAVTRASSEEMARAAKVAQQLGADMSLPATSAADAALAMTELAKGGMTAAQAMDATRGALQLAAAAQIDEAKAAEITANALNTFGLAASDATKVADLLAAASNASSAEITDIASSLQQAGASAAALHIPITDLVTAIGEMANAGIKGSDAGTSLKTFLAALTPTTNEAAGAMKQLGIDAFDAAGNFVGLETVIQQAAPALARMTDEQQAYAIKAAFGSDAQRAANIILGQGVEKFNAMKDAVGQSGAAAELAAAKTKGLSGAWDGLISQLETLGLKIFNAVAGKMEDFVRKVADVAQGLSNLDETTIRVGLTFAAVAGAAGPIALMAGKLLALGPKGAAVGVAIVGIGALAAAYEEDFGKMQDTLDSFASKLIETFTGVKQQQGESAKAWTQLGIIVTQAIDIILSQLNAFLSMMKTVSQSAIAFFTGQWQEIPGIVERGLGEVARAESDFWERSKERGQQFQALQKVGWQDYYDVLAMQTKTGGAKITKEMEDFYTLLRGQTAKSALSTGTTLGENLSQGIGIGVQQGMRQVQVDLSHSFDTLVGPTAAKAEHMFGKVGLGAVKGWDGVTRRSPFFIIHDLEDAATYASTTFADNLSGAAAKAAAKFREAFQAKLGNVNDWLGGLFGAGGLSEENFAIILRNFPKVAAEMDKAATSAKNLKDALELYGAITQTASGKTTDFAITVSRALGSILQFDKALRDLLPIQREYANLDTSKIKAATIITEDFSEAIRKSVGSLAEQTVAAKKAGDAASKLADEDFKKLLEADEELSRQIPHSWNSIVNAIVNGSGKAGDAALKMSVKWKGVAADIIGIVDLLPGKFGDAANKIVSTVDKWFQFGDRILSLLNRLGIDAPKSMQDVVEKIIGVFNKKKPDLEAALDDMLGPVVKKTEAIGTQGGDSFVAGFTKNLGKIAAGITSAIGLVGSVKSGDIFGSAASGAGLGSIIGGLFKHSTMGGVIGLAAGGIAGLIGKLFGLGGKSKEQKEAEKLQLDKMKADIASTYEDIKSTMVDTMQKGVELLESIANSNVIDLPTKAIKRFVNKLSLVLEMWVDAAKGFKGEALAQAKAVSDNLGGSIELMLGGAQLIEAIRTAEDVSAEKIKAFVDTALKIIQAWTEAAGQIELGAAKFAGKISDKLMASFELLKVIPDTIKAVIEASEINLSDEQIAKPIESAKRIIDKFFELSEEFRGYALGKTAKAAEQFKTIFESTKSIFDALKTVAEFTPFPETIFDAVNTDIARVTTWLDGLLDTVKDWLGKSEILRTDLDSFISNLNSGLSKIVASASTNSAAQSVTVQESRPSSSTTTNININGVQLNGDDPRTRAAAQALTDLFGVGGGFESAVNAY